MKLIVILTFVACLRVSAGGYAQTLTLSMKNVPLDAVFKEIKRQSHFDFLYNADLLKNAGNVSIEVKNAGLKDVLDICFRTQPFTYVLQETTILIKKSENSVKAEPNPTFQLINVHGTVFNESGQPLSGANVALKQTGKGITTNAKGEFEFPAVPENSILVVSYIGYAPQQVKVAEGASLQIFLKVTKEELDKVVIQAYGTTTQRLATGNIATVTAAQIERHPVMNVLEALQGQVPGVVVQQTSGYASAPFKVEIRGRASINPDLPSEPLYIIDGVPLTILNPPSSDLPNGGANNYASGSHGFTQNGFNGPAGGQSPFFSINPQDIESLTVLKDADATSIYGSRGANGVIVITTKKGKPGKTKLDLNVYEGALKKTGGYDLLNLKQYLQMRREAFKNDGITPDAGNAYDLVLWDTTRSTDWQKLAIGNIATATDVEAAISGGDKQTNFRLSGSYHTQKSALTYSGAEARVSNQINVTHKSLNQRLNLSFTNLFSYTQSNLTEYTYGITQVPNAPGIFDSVGNLNYSGWQPLNGSYPYASIFQPYTAKTIFINSQIATQYEVAKGLFASVNFGYSTHHGTQLETFPIISQDPSYYPTGRTSFGNNNGTTTIVEPQLEYKGLINSSKLSVLVGGSRQIISQDGQTSFGSGFTNDALLGSISNAPVKDAYGGGQIQYKYAAIFSRINYNWQDKYILNLTARRDGSSRFGPGKQFGNFAAIGAAWIFTEEKWFKNNLPVLSFGKFRGSYGTTGSDQVGEYQYISQWSAISTIPYDRSSPAYIPTILSNPDFKWEVNKKLEAALSVGFLKDRLSAEISWYRNRCNDQLVDIPLPITTGFYTITGNSPANVQNTGWEFIIKGKIIDTKNITWSMNINGGRNFNKLLSFPSLSLSNPYYISHYVVGKPLNITATLHYLGVDPQTGQYTFEDKNKDGVLNAQTPSQGGDTYYKELNILLEGGFGTDFSYKGLQVNLFFTYLENPFLPSAIYNGAPGVVSTNANQSVKVLDRWQKPGDKARFARFTTQPVANDGNFSSSDGVYSNGSYIRLRNASLSYDLPNSWIKKLGIQGCKIYCRGENLFIFTKYEGLDPDVPSLNTLPPAKAFTFGAEINL